MHNVCMDSILNFQSTIVPKTAQVYTGIFSLFKKQLGKQYMWNYCDAVIKTVLSKTTYSELLFKATGPNKTAVKNVEMCFIYFIWTF